MTLNRRRHDSVALSLLLLSGSSGCFTGEPDAAASRSAHLDEIQEAQAGGAAGNGVGISVVECNTDWVCGSNSPEIDSFGFHELNLDGLANAQGISLETYGNAAKLVKNLIEYEMTVSGSRILGTRPGYPTLSGSALVGAELRLTNNGRPYALHIDAVRTISYSVGIPGTLESYRFSWSDSLQLPSNRRPLCAPPTILPSPSGDSAELLSMELDEAVVFETDRFDAAAKTMDPIGNARWFNLGCAGHTLAKMHLTRNTIASGAAAHGVGANDRQATLKMMVADYCGTGKAFTVAGEPLRWKGGAMTSFYTPPTNLEARWTHQGAACLNVPRLRVTTSPLAPELWPDLDAAIAAECSIPACTDTNAHNFDGYARVSANP